MSDEELQNVRLPLGEFVRQIAVEAARTVIVEHVQACEIHEVRREVDSLRVRLAALLGAVGASGILGGSLGAIVSKLL